MDGATSTVAYEHLLKILLIGDMGSNKRQLLHTYMGEEDLTDTTTLGLDYKLKDIVYKGKRVKLQLWDTAGQERFRSVTASYYRGAHGALLVFTLTKETSFVGLNYWLEEISNNAPVKFQVILVATGGGTEECEVNLEIAQQFAREKNLLLYECSPTDKTKVEETLQALVEQIMSSWDATYRGVDSSVRLESSSDCHDSEQKCCS